MDIFWTAMLSLTLVVVATWTHYEVLHLAWSSSPDLGIRHRRRTLAMVAAATMAHMVEIGLYAVAYWVAVRHLHLGRLSGSIEHESLDYLYFSAATFTTLGVGDIVADGALRLLVSVEALNGLVLITWSASFTWLSMRQDWND